MAVVGVLSGSAMVWVSNGGSAPADRMGLTESPGASAPGLTVEPSPEITATATTSPPQKSTLMVLRARTVTKRFEVSSGRLDVSSRWAEGDVVLSLTTPSGRRIDRDTVAADVTHEVGPTFESYHVTSPEPGVWTASLYGARVPSEGEQTLLDIYQAPRANKEPTARIRQTFTGRTVSVDGSSSSDSDGSIVRYLWEFGDGALAEGPTATHTYTEPGTYLVTLAVQDNGGYWDVTSAPSTVHIK